MKTRTAAWGTSASMVRAAQMRVRNRRVATSAVARTRSASPTEPAAQMPRCVVMVLLLSAVVRAKPVSTARAARVLKRALHSQGSAPVVQQVPPARTTASAALIRVYLATRTFQIHVARASAASTLAVVPATHVLAPVAAQVLRSAAPNVVVLRASSAAMVVAAPSVVPTPTVQQARLAQMGRASARPTVLALTTAGVTAVAGAVGPARGARPASMMIIASQTAVVSSRARRL